jgi:ribosomal protein L9
MYSIVEPYASSTIELLIDLFDFYNPQEEIELTPLEASIMYGGIVVDTLNFAFRTSSRTFEIASYLKEKGADNTEVKMWLRRDIIRTLEINKLLESVEIYMNRFAIISTQEIYEDRVLLAQVADEALLIDGMSAAFVVAKISENRIGVSARSYQDMNVQVIMESLGGGGHLNSAAAQISDSTVENVKEEIKKFISLEYGGGEAMKVILLEDVRGRGQKDDVIEVAGGFGQYLISQKKAIIANDENLTKLEQKKTSEQEALQKHLQIMRTLKKEIDGKKITIGIQLGQDEKMFGTVTTKQIVEQFEKEHGVILDRKKLELSSDINSVGIYTATITLHKEIKAQFEVHIVEKKNE